MCGILGWAYPAERALSEETLVGMIGRLAHRGPDGAGTWIGQSPSAAWQIALAHRRLSIIDLSSTGAQPMRGDNGAVLVFNGEIYNYKELRRELERDGSSVRGPGDTAVLLELLVRYGEGAVPKLRGMFAFAYWDPLKGKLLLARDHFGKKPLYIATTRQGGLVFGSELDPVCRLPGVDTRFDWQSLPEYLEYRYIPGPNTFLRGVKKLPPGHVAVWCDGRLEMQRFFEPPFIGEADPIEDEREAEKRFGEALRDAVSIRLRSDAPFGAFLSGGIDSAVVVGLMTQALSRPVKTFSVGFHETAYSELPRARRIADYFRADHTEIVVRAESVVDELPKAVRHRGAPVSEPSDVAILLLSRAAADSVKMVLTGEGSDELLGGYPKHRVDPLIAVYQRLMPGTVHDVVAAPLQRLLPWQARRAAVALRAAGERTFERRMSAWFGATDRTERTKLLAHLQAERPLDGFPFASSASALKRVLFFDQTSWLPDNLLERGDRMTMAESLEARMPFMDVDLSGLVARLPDKLLTGGRGGKTILRRHAQALLPAEIIAAPKVGFRLPVGLWFQTSLRDYLYGCLCGPDSVTAPFYARGALKAVIAEHSRGRRNHEKLLWALLNLELFARHFKPSLS